MERWRTDGLALATLAVNIIAMFRKAFVVQHKAVSSHTGYAKITRRAATAAPPS